MLAGVRTTIARWLEEGTLSSPAARAASRAHLALSNRAVARPLVVPAHIVTVAVGGATLGGSGKTRVALACARELARTHADLNVVLVGHAYRASPRGPRVVAPDDALADVGDEALACARTLARISPRVRVVVAPSRQAAVDFALTLVPRVDALVLDGPLQLAPARASLSVLALDAAAPWGAGVAPPSGDLRASPEVLLSHADHVVHVDATPVAVELGSPPRVIDLASFAASSPRVGLFTALARPDRLVRALTAAGLRPHELVRAPDHGPLGAGLARQISRADRKVDVWLATSKCALHLAARCAAELTRPLAILDGSLDLPAATSRALRDLVEARVAPAYDSGLHACLDPSIPVALLSSQGPRSIT